jgi:hypothetical protein
MKHEKEDAKNRPPKGQPSTPRPEGTNPRDTATSGQPTAKQH